MLKQLKFLTAGESHGQGLLGILDGLPAGLEISENYIDSINRFIKFDRSFKKWDLINQSIILAALSELNNVEKNKIKIVLNDYLNVGKSFVDDKEIKTINAILDKIIYDKK